MSADAGDACPNSDPSPFRSRLAEPGVIERCELRSAFGFMAYHGGALEANTDVIAAAAAEAAGASLYSVRHPPPGPSHIASTLVRPADSAALAGFCDHVDVAITVHGYGRWGMFTSLLLGGSNRDLAESLAERLRPALPDYDVVTDLAAMPHELRGQHPDNPVNLPRRGGVQLELPPRIRGLGPAWDRWEGPGLTPPTVALIEQLAITARRWSTGDAARRAR